METQSNVQQEEQNQPTSITTDTITSVNTSIQKVPNSMLPLMIALVFVLIVGIIGLGAYIITQNQNVSSNGQGNSNNTAQDQSNNTAEDSQDSTINNDNQSGTNSISDSDNSNNSEETSEDTTMDATEFLIAIESEFSALQETGDSLMSIQEASSLEEAVSALEQTKSGIADSIAKIQGLPKVSGDEAVRSSAIELFELLYSHVDQIIVLASSGLSEETVLEQIEEKTIEFQTEANIVLEELEKAVSEFASKNEK